LGNDLSNFENGNVGMIIGYAADLASIETAGPNLNVGVAPAPQVDPTNAVNFPNYWGIAVTRTSIDPQMSWNFAYFAATDAISAQNYSSATSLPPALRTLIAQDSTSPASPMGVFASQALTARDWTQPNPASVSGIFDTMIKSVTSGQTSVYNAISQAESAVTALMPIQ
jgi:maltose-binding protein MalE